MYCPVGAARAFSPVCTSSSSEDTEVNGYDSKLLQITAAKQGSFFATISRTTVSLWQSKPTAQVAQAVRSKNSIESYGENVGVFIRPDGLIIVLQTAKGYFITYSVAWDTYSRLFRPHFPAGSNGHQNRVLGVGESRGVQDCSLRFRMIIKIDAGIEHALALEDSLMVATAQPAAIQIIRWKPDSSGEQTKTLLLEDLLWIRGKEAKVSVLVYDRPMNLHCWVTADGCAYAVQRMHKGGLAFKGYCIYNPEVGSPMALSVCINARFSLIAVALSDGNVVVYNVRDYEGNIPLSHSFTAPSTTGKLKHCHWSPDGNCFYASYGKGWMLWSVFGMPGASTFSGSSVISFEAEPYLSNVTSSAWLCNGAELALVSTDSEELFIIEMARSAIACSLMADNLSRSLIVSNEKLFIYRGYNQPDHTAISQDALLWQTVRIPLQYLADQFPIRQTAISPNGRYVAIAGKRGLAHYSVHSGRWKLFINDAMEEDFTVRGGMCWYQHILIAAVEADSFFEIRLYSRETDLDNQRMLHQETMPAPVVVMSILEESLLVFTSENILYHYMITSTIDTVQLTAVGQLGFNGIIHAPQRVRDITWILPEEQLRNGDPARDVTLATVLLLIDGKLAILKPTVTDEGDIKYGMRVLLHHVEYFRVFNERQTTGPLKDSLWVLDGNTMKVWRNVFSVLEDLNTPSTNVQLDFYPLSVMIDKGIIVGMETEIIQRQKMPYSVFRFNSRPELAIAVAIHYRSLAYFAHALEILLHEVLDTETDTQPDAKEAILPRVAKFLQPFPEMLDVIAGCTRKTDASSWRHLFKSVGSPKELFEKSMDQDNLKTAGAYLLVLHNLEHTDDSSRDMQRLFDRAMQRDEWDLLKDLSRFLLALDSTGNTLRRTLSASGNSFPVSELQLQTRDTGAIDLLL